MEKKMYFVGYNYEGTPGADNYEIVMASNINKVYDYVGDCLYDGFDAYYNGINREDYDSDEEYEEELDDMRDSICTSFVEIFDPNDEFHACVFAEDGVVELG